MHPSRSGAHSSSSRVRSGFYRYRNATLGYSWSIDSIGVTTLTYNFKISIRMAQSLLISEDVEVGRSLYPLPRVNYV